MGKNLLAEAWSELAIAICVIGLRLYYRITQVGFRKLGVDDYLMVCAGAVYACETTTAHFLGVWLGLANNNITPEGRATLDPNSQEWRFRVNGSKTHVVGWFIYTALFWLLKCCWTVYYSRMTDGVRKMDMRIKLAWWFIGATYIAAICMILFKCWPLHRQWQINPDPGNNCQAGFSKLQVSFIMAINTATDLYLMAIPIPIIWKAQLDMKRKISLIILFSGGWIVIIFGIVRCVTLVTVEATEPDKSGEWSVRESFVAVLVSNAPMIFPLFKRWIYAATNLTSSSFRSNKTGQSYPLDSNIKRSGGNSHACSSSGRKIKNFQHPLSIPNDTAWGSDERIVHIGEEGKKDSWKAGDKSSNESLNTARDQVHILVPQRAASVPTKKGSGNGFNDIVMTKEWDVSEAYEQDGGKLWRGSHFGAAQGRR